MHRARTSAWIRKSFDAGKAAALQQEESPTREPAALVSTEMAEAEGATAFVRLNTGTAGDAAKGKPHKGHKEDAAVLAALVAELSTEQSETEEGAGAAEAARAASDVEEEELVCDWR